MLPGFRAAGAVIGAGPPAPPRRVPTTLGHAHPPALGAHPASLARCGTGLPGPLSLGLHPVVELRLPYCAAVALEAFPAHRI